MVGVSQFWHSLGFRSLISQLHLYPRRSLLVMIAFLHGVVFEIGGWLYEVAFLYQMSDGDPFGTWTRCSSLFSKATFLRIFI